MEKRPTVRPFVIFTIFLRRERSPRLTVDLPTINFLPCCQLLSHCVVLLPYVVVVLLFFFAVLRIVLRGVIIPGTVYRLFRKNTGLMSKTIPVACVSFARRLSFNIPSQPGTRGSAHRWRAICFTGDNVFCQVIQVMPITLLITITSNSLVVPVN